MESFEDDLKELKEKITAEKLHLEDLKRAERKQERRREDPWPRRQHGPMQRMEMYPERRGCCIEELGDAVVKLLKALGTVSWNVFLVLFRICGVDLNNPGQGGGVRSHPTQSPGKKVQVERRRNNELNKSSSGKQALIETKCSMRHRRKVLHRHVSNDSEMKYQMDILDQEIILFKELNRELTSRCELSEKRCSRLLQDSSPHEAEKWKRMYYALKDAGMKMENESAKIGEDFAKSIHSANELIKENKQLRQQHENFRKRVSYAKFHCEQMLSHHDTLVTGFLDMHRWKSDVLQAAKLVKDFIQTHQNLPRDSS